jgi:hypothetical protein
VRYRGCSHWAPVSTKRPWWRLTIRKKYRRLSILFDAASWEPLIHAAMLLRAPGRGAQAYSAPLQRFVAPAECSRGLGRISHAARTALAFPALDCNAREDLTRRHRRLWPMAGWRLAIDHEHINHRDLQVVWQKAAMSAGAELRSSGSQQGTRQHGPDLGAHGRAISLDGFQAALRSQRCCRRQCCSRLGPRKRVSPHGRAPHRDASLSNPRPPRSEFAVHGVSNRESRMLPWGADLLLESAAGGQGESPYGRLGIRHRLDRHQSFDGLQRNSVSLTQGEPSAYPSVARPGIAASRRPTDGQSDHLQAPRRRGYERETREGSQWGNKVRLRLDVTTPTLNRR